MKKQNNIIFVFGSNLAGRHGKGSAKFAKSKRGAIQGVAEGIQGDSYGIPTKDHVLNTLPLPTIKAAVDRFIAFANDHDELTFVIAAIGCKNAGYKPKDIAPMFKDVPPNCILPKEFQDILLFDYHD